MQTEMFNEDLSIDGSLLKEHLNKMIFIGTLKINGEQLEYQKSPNIQRKELNEDLVYYMVCKGQLMKIGIAGGMMGWNGRVGMYRKGILNGKGDGTNHRIFRIMKERKLTKELIYVFGIYTPPQVVDVICPMNGTVVQQEVQIHRNIERSLTAEFLSEGYELPFSKQLN